MRTCAKLGNTGIGSNFYHRQKRHGGGGGGIFAVCHCTTGVVRCLILLIFLCFWAFLSFGAWRFPTLKPPLCPGE